MKPVKIAMMGMTHGHTRKYYQTLIENKKLDWVASCAQDEEAKRVYELYETGVPCYLDPDEMYRKHPEPFSATPVSTKQSWIPSASMTAWNVPTADGS